MRYHSPPPMDQWTPMKTTVLKFGEEVFQRK